MEKLDAVADRGYFNSEEILACEEAGITVTLTAPLLSKKVFDFNLGLADTNVNVLAIPWIPTSLPVPPMTTT